MSRTGDHLIREADEHSVENAQSLADAPDPYDVHRLAEAARYVVAVVDHYEAKTTTSHPRLPLANPKVAPAFDALRAALAALAAFPPTPVAGEVPAVKDRTPQDGGHSGQDCDF